MTKLSLPNVTLLTIDTDPEQGLWALERCTRHADFGDVVLLTSLGAAESGSTLPRPTPHTRVVPIDVGARGWPNWYARLMLTELYKHVNTAHVLKIETDGFITDPSAWDPAFLDYDYVGAPWPWEQPERAVGNGGFSLRSKKLLEATAQVVYEAYPRLDDVFICRVARKILEQQNKIRFAPTELAERFSYERRHTPGTFGFHGLYNMHRYLRPTELLEYLEKAPEYVFKKPEYDELLNALKQTDTQLWADVLGLRVTRQDQEVLYA